MRKNANQLYKDYRKEGGTLNFAGWINREKKKGFLNATGDVQIPLNQPLSDSISRTLDSMHRQAGYQDSLSNEYVLGVNRNVWIGIGIVAAVGIGYLIYQKTKK
jgi:hypothetical protein